MGQKDGWGQTSGGGAGKWVPRHAPSIHPHPPCSAKMRGPSPSKDRGRPECPQSLAAPPRGMRGDMEATTRARSADSSQGPGSLSAELRQEHPFHPLRGEGLQAGPRLTFRSARMTTPEFLGLRFSCVYLRFTQSHWAWGTGTSRDPHPRVPAPNTHPKRQGRTESPAPLVFVTSTLTQAGGPYSSHLVGVGVLLCHHL